MNARFRNARHGSGGSPARGGDLDAAGILLHQFDDWEDPTAPWSPCPLSGGTGVCSRADAQTRKDRVSASIIYSGMQRADRPDRNVIPIFSHRGGVILRPEATTLLCAYGMDAGIDYGADQRVGNPNCHAAAGSACVPGCGNPPEWCDPDVGLINGWCTCGFAWSCGNQNSPRPWRPEDLLTMLDKHATLGDTFKGISTFSGYNEIIVQSAAWIANLPRSIEAFVVVAGCSGDEEAFVRRAHRDFAARFGASAAPLVRLRPEQWEHPFVLEER